MRFTEILLAISIASASVAMVASCPASAAEDNYPPEIPKVDGIRSTLSAPPVKELHLGNLKVEFERTTLSDIVRALGVGTIRHRGDASESEYWLCFTAISRGTSQRIWISSGEIGGDVHFVESVLVTAISDKDTPSACPQLPARFRRLSLGNAPWVGAREEDLQKLLGSPSLERDDWRFYSYNGKVPKGDFDESALLGVRVKNGTVITLVASKVTTG
jgi:hypothetical protein